MEIIGSVLDRLGPAPADVPLLAVLVVASGHTPDMTAILSFDSCIVSIVKSGGNNEHGPKVYLFGGHGSLGLGSRGQYEIQRPLSPLMGSIESQSGAGQSQWKDPEISVMMSGCFTSLEPD
jgi:hypothetical protein